MNLPGYGSIVHGRMSHGGPFYPRQYVPPGGEPSLDASPLTDEQVATLRERARARQVLDLDIGDNPSGKTTVRGYLLALLAKLWTEVDDFSGKRPFGSSDWQCDVYVPMVKAGLIPGSLDEDGYLDEIDYKVADALMLAAIAELGARPAQITLTGYQDAAQHTYTTACDGFHEPGQCPDSSH